MAQLQVTLSSGLVPSTMDPHVIATGDTFSLTEHASWMILSNRTEVDVTVSFAGEDLPKDYEIPGIGVFNVDGFHVTVGAGKISIIKLSDVSGLVKGLCTFSAGDGVEAIILR